MKTLELTVYPPAVCICELGGEHATGYDWNCDAMDHGWMRVASHNKRLTDPELAAEVFSAVLHEAECEVRGRKLALRVGNNHPAVDHYAKQNHEFGRQATIIERFATLPHYDEDQP